MKSIKFISLALFLMVLMLWYSCSDITELDQNQSPTAVFSFTPENADTSTVFTFDAAGSGDLEDPISSLLFRWDFEGKYNWTEPENNPVANHKFTKPGIYNVGLKVIDTEGWSSEARTDVIVKDSL